MPLIVTTFTAPGFTPEMYKWYDTHVYDMAHVVDSATKFWKLEDVNKDFAIAHQRIFTPMMVSNRSMIHTMMTIHDTEDRWCTGSTTVGNDDLV